MKRTPPISAMALGMTVVATSASAAWSHTPRQTRTTGGQRSFSADVSYATRAQKRSSAAAASAARSRGHQWP